MANYDEQRGAWTDYSGGVHNTEQDALNSNSRLMGDRDGSSTSSYNPVDLNSPEYNTGGRNNVAANAHNAMVDKAEALRKQGEILVDRGYDLLEKRDFSAAYPEFDKAIKIYQQVLEIPVLKNKNIADICNCIGLAYAGKLEATTAIAYYDRAIELWGNYEVAYYNRGKSNMLLRLEILSNPSHSYEYSKKASSEYMNKAIADWKMAADLGFEPAIQTLAEEGIEYTPQRRKKSAKTTSPSAATQSAAGEKKGGIVSGIVLGVICGFLGIIGIGGLMIIVTGDAGWKMETRNFFIGLAVLAAIFTLVWRKRKWLWVVLLFALAAFGGYVLVGAPGLDGAMTETVQPAAATVTAGTLNLRAEPSTTGAVVEKLNRGDRLTLAGEQANGWLEVEYNGKKGYVDAKYVTVE